MLGEPFIGADVGITEDLVQNLPGEWRRFNIRDVPVFLAGRPDKTAIGAGPAGGALCTVVTGIRNR